MNSRKPPSLNCHGTLISSSSSCQIRMRAQTAHKQNPQNSEGVCQKLCRAVSVCPIKAKIHRIYHQFSTGTDDPNTKNPAVISPPQSQPVQVVHQPSFSRKIPIESEPSAQKNENPAVVSEFGKREGVIINGENAKRVTSSRKDSTAEQSEEKFSDYISKVKKRMLKTVSSLGGGGGGGGRSETKKDSFDGKVTSYIDHTRMKIRTTTSLGDHQRRISLK